MWSADNGSYTLSHFEHQNPAAKVDRLLNTITTTDRAIGLGWPRWIAHLVAKASKWVSLRRHSPAAPATMLDSVIAEARGLGIT